MVPDVPWESVDILLMRRDDLFSYPSDARVLFDQYVLTLERLGCLSHSQLEPNVASSVTICHRSKDAYISRSPDQPRPMLPQDKSRLANILDTVSWLVLPTWILTCYAWRTVTP